MGLYLLNISVDTADIHPEHITEDLSINDQESIIEFVVEQVLGYEDAFEEYDDHDTEDHNKKNNTKIELIPHVATDLKLNRHPLISTQQNYSHHSLFLTIGFKKLDAPPPKI